MRKIRLEPETLTVESFAAGESTVDVRGTVNGNAPATNVCPTAFTFCETNCDCTFGCYSVMRCPLTDICAA